MTKKFTVKEARTIAEKIEERAYNATTANTDWDSDFDLDEATRIIFNAVTGEDFSPAHQLAEALKQVLEETGNNHLWVAQQILIAFVNTNTKGEKKFVRSCEDHFKAGKKI